MWTSRAVGATFLPLIGQQGVGGHGIVAGVWNVEGFPHLEESFAVLLFIIEP